MPLGWAPVGGCARLVLSPPIEVRLEIKNYSPEEIAAAHHEAAHAIVGVGFGRVPIKIYLWPGRSGVRWEAVPDYSRDLSGQARAGTDITILMAGRQAEELLGTEPEDARTHADEDYRSADRVADAAGLIDDFGTPEADAFFTAKEAEALLLVQKYSKNIVAVAGLLLAKRTLSGEEVRAVLGDSA